MWLFLLVLHLVILIFIFILFYFILKKKNKIVNVEEPKSPFEIKLEKIKKRLKKLKYNEV